MNRILYFFHPDSPDFEGHPDPEGAAWSRALLVTAGLTCIVVAIQTHFMGFYP